MGFVVFAWFTGEEAEENEEEARGDAAADELEPEEFDDEGFEDAYEGFEESQAAPTALADGSLDIHEIVGYVVLGLLIFRAPEKWRKRRHQPEALRIIRN